MSESYVWTETRLRAIELFHDVPSAAVEQRILDVFLEHPHLVIEAVEKIGRRFANGQVRSPWAVLAKAVSEMTSSLEGTATDERDRDKAIRSAEQWMRAAGKHFDRVEEVMEELFGDNGRIPQFETPELRERLGRLWRETRGEGELIEQQAEERARRYIELNGVVIDAQGNQITPPPWRLGHETRPYVVEPLVKLEERGLEDEPEILDEEPALA